jgi:CrcB protein
MTLLGIALAGAAGTLARYGLSGLTHRLLGSAFPWGTLTVNLIGCCLLGFLLELSRQSGWISPDFRTIAGIGFLGGFTTFSTFGAETYRAFESGDWLMGALNVLANVAGGVVLVAAGGTLARSLTQFVRFMGQAGGGS